ncbi:DUF2599 domain-containing protein [Isoptericola sediminis]|uniref:DUF2599 domain-containing protein n=1 Tax=Isoptericola sediminis TaxID=2733572 RepID=UPI001C09BFF0
MRLSPGGVPGPVAATAVLALLLTSCAPGNDGGPEDDGARASPPATSSTPPAPSPSSPSPVARLELVVGELPLELAGRWTDSTAPRPEGSGTTTALTVPSGALPLTFALPEGGFVRHADGSVGVLGAPDGGTPVAGLSAPDGPAVFRQVDTRHVELVRTGDGGTSDPGDVSTTVGTRGLVDATWGEREGGRSLAVDPTAWARSAGVAGVELVRAELAAADPEADTATMHDQLRCHALGAPDKDTWNLEPWRPDVGLVAVLAARCNPVEGS